MFSLEETDTNMMYNNLPNQSATQLLVEKNQKGSSFPLPLPSIPTMTFQTLVTN
jgi:hypothetical protein